MKSFYLYLLFFFSGVAGLGYEILWTRMLSVALGHEIVSMLGVVCAFFSGLAMGAWALDRRISRSVVPQRWYAGLEMTVGIWALVLLWVLPFLNDRVTDLIGVAPSPLRHWSIAFLYPFIVLLPATTAMGATLTAMDRIFERFRGTHRAVAGLYGINTLGAVAGTFGVTFLLLPATGMTHTSLVLAAINIIGAVGMIMLARGRSTSEQPVAVDAPVYWNRLRLYLTLVLTGIAGIGFEVLMVRALSQILENTVFSFAALLMVFLFGTASGAGFYQRTVGRKKGRSIGEKNEKTLALLLLSTSFFCLTSIFMLRYATSLFNGLQTVLGSGFWPAVLSEITIALLFFTLPTVCMGATFSHLAQGLKRPDGGVGRALCLNTLGGATAPLLFGVLLLPGIGLDYALLIIPALYVCCLPRLQPLYVATAAMLLVCGAVVTRHADSHPYVSLSPGETIVSHRDGVMASVSVVKDPKDALHLKVNNHYQMGGTTSLFSDRRQAYLPILLHPRPERALFLGLGTGVTFSAAANFPDLEADGVELVPEVIQAMDFFEDATGDLSTRTNLTIINADARRYVTATDRTYDVIIADLFHPSRDGAGTLYTVEHFAAVRHLLTDTGIFCQWLPLYQLDLEMFKVIVRTFLQVFPHGQAYMAHYSVDQPIIGLVGGRQRLRFPEKWYRKRVQGKNFRRAMAGYGYDSIYSLLGTFIAGGDALKEYVGACPTNTDDHPVVMFQAPRFVYGEKTPAADRLRRLLAAFSPPNPESLLSEEITEEDHMARSRLAAYWAARDRFIELGMAAERTRDVQKLFATVSEPLLEVVKMSIDFSAAYYPLISIAYELYPHDRDAAYELLRRLERANPLKREAGILRQRLYAGITAPVTASGANQSGSGIDPLP